MPKLITYIFLSSLLLTLPACSLFERPTPTRTEEAGSIVYTNVADGRTEVAGFEFPFVVEVEDLNNTTMSNGKTVIIQDPKLEWENGISEINIANEWQLLSDEKYYDGGSSKQIYFLEKRKPMVKIFNQWDMNEGGMKAMSIDLIHPADIVKTLIDIRGRKAIEFENLDLEEFLDCSGLVGLYQTGVYACIGYDNEIIELY